MERRPLAGTQAEGTTDPRPHAAPPGLQVRLTGTQPGGWPIYDAATYRGATAMGPLRAGPLKRRILGSLRRSRPEAKWNDA